MLQRNASVTCSLIPKILKWVDAKIRILVLHILIYQNLFKKTFYSPKGQCAAFMNASIFWADLKHMFSYSNVSLWFSQGQLHKILGIQPGTHGAKLREACKLARLKTHPDKGGDVEVFKIVEETIKILLNDLPEVKLHQPIWLNSLRQQIDRCRLGFDRGCGDIGQMQRLREEFKRAFHEYQQRVEAEHLRREQTVREERERQERIAQLKKEKADRELREKLRKRCTRKPSTKFPVLPSGFGSAPLSQLQGRYHSLGQQKCKKRKLGQDVTSIEADMAQVLHEGHAIVELQVENECLRLGIIKQFPRLATTHPKYEAVMLFRSSYRKLKDLARKYPNRDHLKRAGVILQQALDLMKL